MKHSEPVRQDDPENPRKCIMFLGQWCNTVPVETPPLPSTLPTLIQGHRMTKKVRRAYLKMTQSMDLTKNSSSSGHGEGSPSWGSCSTGGWDASSIAASRCPPRNPVTGYETWYIQVYTGIYQYIQYSSILYRLILCYCIWWYRMLVLSTWWYRMLVLRHSFVYQGLY